MKFNIRILAVSLLALVTTEASTANAWATGQDDEEMAACLHVMDDNHRLPEWLAFHWHVLPLRRLIVSVDPRSQASPMDVLEPWKDLIHLEVWHEADYFAEEDKQAYLPLGLTAVHRARQRKFNVECMTALRKEGSGWVLMTDSDEFTMVNQRYGREKALNPSHIDIPSTASPGSVLKTLQNLPFPSLRYGYVSACVPIHRRQFGGKESSLNEVTAEFPKDYPASIRPQSLETFRWRHWGSDYITARNGTLPGKALINLRQLKDDDVALFSGDPHRPIEKICSPRRAWSLSNETLFVADHYLGSSEEYLLRDDARLVDRLLTYEQRKLVSGNTSDDARHWLRGFAAAVGNEAAVKLLHGAGQLLATKAKKSSSKDTPTCALAFFGLPRSFRNLALPSIVKNILLTNAEYGCDLFIHYYERHEESQGRFNRGGKLITGEVEAIKVIFELVAERVGILTPTIVLEKETEHTFWKKHGSTVDKYTYEKDEEGRFKYFPYGDPTYTSPTQIENIVKQWISIESVWNLMESSAQKSGTPYDRVAMLRLDAFYATPVDIFKASDSTWDKANKFAVVPGFGKHPVNDRMMIGPHHAVKIWATERFSHLDKHIASYTPKGLGMHPERFLAHSIFPAIEALGVTIHENTDICFYRTRASDALILSDCDSFGKERGMTLVRQQDEIEQVIHRYCVQYILDDQFTELRCDADSRNIETQKLFLSAGKDELTPLDGQEESNGRRVMEQDGRRIDYGNRWLQTFSPSAFAPIPPGVEIPETVQGVGVTFNIAPNSGFVPGTFDLIPFLDGIQKVIIIKDEGEYRVNDGGDVEFVPFPDFVGVSTLRYTYEDDSGNTVSVEIGVTVNAPDRPDNDGSCCCAMSMMLL